MEAVDELIAIAREAGVPAEIYHLKAAGKNNWGKLDEVIRKVEAARAEGLRITADMYTYTAGATGLDAAMRGTSPEETAMDLVVEDGSRVGAVYFLMSEENVRRKITLPWVSFGSDEGSYAPEGVFLKSACHPRAYGNVARLLGRYVRDESVIPLAEAVRRLTAFPADHLGLDHRGRLVAGDYADVVVFDPAAIQDHATYESPHQYASGVRHVFVNGIQVLEGGEHTGAKPGRVVRGPGWKGRAADRLRESRRAG